MDLTTPPPDPHVLATGILNLIFGVIGLVCNLITLLVIGSNKHLRSPCFSLITIHASCSFLMAIGYLTDGARRSGFYFDPRRTESSRVGCFLIYIPKLVAIPVHSAITCLIGVDRLLAVLKPTVYDKFDRRYLPWIAGYCALLIVGALLGAVLPIRERMDDPIVCTSFMIPFHPRFVNCFIYHNLCCSIVSVCIYVSIIISVRWRKRQLKLDGSSGDGGGGVKIVWTTRIFPTTTTPTPISTANLEWIQESFALKKQLLILPVIHGLMTAYLLFSVCPEILATVAGSLVGETQNLIILYAAVLKSIGVCTDFLALATKCDEFRTTLRDLFIRI